MKRSAKVRMALVGAAVAATTLAVQPASASTGSMTMTGSGVSSPGLGLSTPPQTFTFSGFGAAATNTYQGSMNCTWNGWDAIGTIAQSSGSFSGTCTFGTTTEPVSGTYTRNGFVKTVSGTIGPGPVTGSFTGVCTWEPTSAPTATSYDEQCNYVVH